MAPKNQAMIGPGRTRIGIAALLLLLGTANCRKAPPSKEKALQPPPQAASAEALTVASAEPEPSAEPEGSASSAPAGSQAPVTADSAQNAGGSKRKKSGSGRRSTARFILDGPEQPIAMGGAATVFSKGIIWRLSGKGASVSLFGPNGPAPGPSEPERSKKWPGSRVAVAEDASGAMHAYWIEGKDLIRNTITPDGKLDGSTVVANDAMVGTTPAALRSNGRDVVAYMAVGNARNAERHARLWVEGGGILDLSPEGSGASSISLVPVGDGQVIAMWLDARSAMTPVHARRFEVREKTTAIAEDDVVFVGGPPEGYPEITAVRSGASAAALIAQATEKGFALHNILVNWQGKSKVKMLDYPNGMETAPVAAAHACGESIVVYARPEAKAPGSPQVLELATLGSSGSIDVEEVAAYPGQVQELSAAAVDENTAWVVYTANLKSFALRISCGDKPAAK